MWMSENSAVPQDLPGAELVNEGLADLAMGRDSVNALAVAMASTRLRAAGIDVLEGHFEGPAAHRLYEQLAREDPRNAYGRYNAIVRRMVSFAQAAEHAASRRLNPPS
jgi:hypothetical protein